MNKLTLRKILNFAASIAVFSVLGFFTAESSFAQKGPPQWYDGEVGDVTPDGCYLKTVDGWYSVYPCFPPRPKDSYGECNADFFRDLSNACTGGCTCEVSTGGRETKCRHNNDTYLMDCDPRNGSSCFCASYHPSRMDR